MAFTFKELKQAKQNIMDAFGLSSSDAVRVVGYFNGGGPALCPDIVTAMINGDLSGVGPALAALGLHTDDKQEKIGCDPQKITRKDQAKKTSGPKNGGSKQKNDSDTKKNKGKNDLCEGVGGPDDIEIVGDSHELPPGLYDDICATLENYCRQQNMDPGKIHPLQWKSACIYIGQTIKARGILRDYEREKNHGGVLYDGVKVSALLDIYDYICGQYKQVPFVYNFPRFAGISQNYFADYENRLTSSRVGLYKKALDIQKAGLIDAVNGGGSATVGNIFLSKALAGLQETVTIQHVSAASTPAAVALPVFGPDGGLLEEKRPE